ncbi:COX5B, subunit VB of cytochrome c oxidase [Serpula lacrymans var. lacrymans S7.3]|uniref:COX5B, subunit VB of cytochrome c oxidase n=2 Tax=Serpula lacrymans var. lacrymans TaxID=341189 RepID=F8PXK0_SERL3|nr:subunit VB of cytochrome c oxidase,COX5B [Serpula lacrymans var. lacrymans S7.9]EGN98613.1 COX5B, subunit VB of cytochrome c oxidase [Serpula lacrymans var. lacrymans S7.3]EGO24180.1 subunit VB of cytochrome c oxidase,COX5B [Serpula lacrymans var. lacrymans S7.9]
MFQAALRAAARPAALASRSALKPSSASLRALSTTASRLSGPAAPSLYGPGSKAGEIPSDETQATGLERFQLLGEIEGVDSFDLEPLDASRVGTLENPIKVFSLDTERIVGCTGSPADSHELHWFTVKHDKTRRCAECGSAYALDFQGSLDAHDAHH